MQSRAHAGVLVNDDRPVSTLSEYLFFRTIMSDKAIIVGDSKVEFSESVNRDSRVYTSDSVNSLYHSDSRIPRSRLVSRYPSSYSTVRYLDEVDGVRDGKYYGTQILPPSSPTARILDEADGVLDGKYYGRDIVSRKSSARILDEADGVLDGRYYGRDIVSRRSPARILDDADGVLDGRYYGRDIVTRSVPSRAQINSRAMVERDHEAKRWHEACRAQEERDHLELRQDLRRMERKSDIIIVDSPNDVQSLKMQNEDLQEQLCKMKDRYNNLAFNASHVRRDAAMLRRLVAENKALRADYDILVVELQGRDKSHKLQEENRRLLRELEELRRLERELRRQPQQPCNNCGTLNAEIASLRRRIAELEAEIYQLKLKPVAVAEPPVALEEVEEW